MWLRAALAVPGHLGHGRGDVHDRAAVALEHVRDQELREQHGGGHVEVEGRLEGLRIELQQGCGRGAARVVHEHVDPTKGLEGGGRQALQLGGLGDVAGDGEGLGAEAAQLFGHGLDLLGRARRADHPGPGLGKGSGTARSDAAARTGHHGHLVSQSKAIQDHALLPP
jgi:hypothetical protein